ncbi:ABC transporter ATP-binding protein [Pseudonocardia sp. GCM10023141]|uniref:ABC transporter ATP-binding protein n=1 Tax=Pseudonocardia sp. GCM10023141 TaxID=3252653 RepID=UPI0036157974
MIAHLSVRGLACAIGRRVILRHVDIDVAGGEVVGIVGANGTGKSTLLRALAGIRPAAAGEVLVHGERLAAMPARARARALALVEQEDDLPADLLAGELVALGRIPHRPPWAGGDATERSAVLSALAQVDLAFAVDVPVGQLSGGERRRVLLARGLAQESPLLLLDEPTNHLDVRHQHALLQTVRSLGRTVVAAMHDLDLAAAYCDRIVVLHDGGVLAVGTPEQALTPDLVRQAFGVLATPVVHPGTGRVHLLFSADGGA